METSERIPPPETWIQKPAGVSSGDEFLRISLKSARPTDRLAVQTLSRSCRTAVWTAVPA